MAEPIPSASLFFELNDSSRVSLCANPKLRNAYVQELDCRLGNLQDVAVVQFIFNDRILHNVFERQAEANAKVRVLSIPLQNGYRKGKSGFAEAIYTSSRKYEMRVCPLIFAYRPEKVASLSTNGDLDCFSLHGKFLIARRRDGTGVAIVTSSNMDVNRKGNAQDNVMVVVDHLPVLDTNLLLESFDGVWNSSVENDNYRPEEWTDSRGKYPITSSHPGFGMVGMTSPMVAGSPDELKGRILSMVASPKKRLVICGEHVSDFDSFAEDLVRTANRGVPVLILSQTYPKLLATSGMTAPRTRAHNERANSLIDHLVSANTEAKIAWGYCNDIHFKGVVSDDEILVCNHNITYSSLSSKWAPKFWYNSRPYDNAFVEIGAYVHMENPTLAHAFCYDLLGKVLVKTNSPICFPIGSVDVARQICG